MSRPQNQRPLGDSERALLRLYVNCSLSLSHPRQLYREYAFTYDQLAMIAGCSIPTMERWMSRNREPQVYKTIYLRRLGEFHFLLNHYHQLPQEVWDSVCPLPPQLRAILFPSDPTA